MLLLDEPLSALDAKVRAQLRDQIRRIQLEVGITTLFVTHDQEEALAIADRVGVMRAGQLEQLAPPTEVYSRPATPFVAEFVGLSNRLAGTVSGSTVTVRGRDLPLVDLSTPPGPVMALVRPEAVTLASDSTGEPGPLVGTVIASRSSARPAVSPSTWATPRSWPSCRRRKRPNCRRAAGSTLTIRPDPVLCRPLTRAAVSARGERQDISAAHHRSPARPGRGTADRISRAVPRARDHRRRAAYRP